MVTECYKRSCQTTQSTHSLDFCRHISLRIPGDVNVCAYVYVCVVSAKHEGVRVLWDTSKALKAHLARVSVELGFVIPLVCRIRAGVQV